MEGTTGTDKSGKIKIRGRENSETRKATYGGSFKKRKFFYRRIWIKSSKYSNANAKYCINKLKFKTVKWQTGLRLVLILYMMK